MNKNDKFSRLKELSVIFTISFLATFVLINALYYFLKMFIDFEVKLHEIIILSLSNSLIVIIGRLIDNNKDKMTVS